MTDNQEPTRLFMPGSRRPARSSEPAAEMMRLPSRPWALPVRWAGIGAASAGMVGGVAGLVVGLKAHPPTAWFAIFELGIPGGAVGGLVGLVAGTIAFGIRTHVTGDTARQTGLFRTEASLPDVVVTVGALAVLYALHSMEWASKLDDRGRTTLNDGPTALLAVAAVASLALSLIIVGTRWRWPRWLLLATTLTTAGTAAIVAISRIAAANDSGARRTSYEPGAAVGVCAAFLIAAYAFVGFYDCYKRAEAQTPAGPPRPTDPTS
jgi:hypothetical protein